MANAIIQTTTINPQNVLQYQASIFSHVNFAQAATAFATELCIEYGFERVSIGMMKGSECSIEAVSHSADSDTKYEVHRQLSLAMEEAISQAVSIQSPNSAPTQPRIAQANHALQKMTGHHICSIPLTHQHDIFGAICIESLNSNQIHLADLMSVIGLIAPVLQLKWQSETPWYARLKQVLVSKMDTFVLGKQGITRPLILLLSLGLIALLWIPVTYHISAPARLEGAIQQALVAPDHGYLEQAMVRPGDSVKQNQVLATLANQELLLEKRRWQTELEQYENAYSTSLAQSNRVDLVVNQSKAEEARVQLALIEQKLQHTQVLAPFDGVIIKGDLKDSVGAPLQRGDTLLTIAPTASFRLMIEVDERDISHVLTGQQGQLALVSLPNQRIQFTVARIVPVAIVKDERNMFEVEGMLQAKQLALLKPGLEGIAKIGVGLRHFIWLLSHRMIDWFKLNLWSWGL